MGEHELDAAIEEVRGLMWWWFARRGSVSHEDPTRRQCITATARSFGKALRILRAVREGDVDPPYERAPLEPIVVLESEYGECPQHWLRQAYERAVTVVDDESGEQLFAAGGYRGTTWNPAYERRRDGD